MSDSTIVDFVALCEKEIYESDTSKSFDWHAFESMGPEAQQKAGERRRDEHAELRRLAFALMAKAYCRGWGCESIRQIATSKLWWPELFLEAQREAVGLQKPVAVVNGTEAATTPKLTQADDSELKWKLVAGKLTERMNRSIPFESQEAMAREFCVSPATVNKAINSNADLVNYATKIKGPNRRQVSQKASEIELQTVRTLSDHTDIIEPADEERARIAIMAATVDNPNFTDKDRELLRSQLEDMDPHELVRLAGQSRFISPPVEE